MRSPILSNLRMLAIGNIFIANARLKQMPAPPVAKTNEIFAGDDFVESCNDEQAKRKKEE